MGHDTSMIHRMVLAVLSLASVLALTGFVTATVDDPTGLENALQVDQVDAVAKTSDEKASGGSQDGVLEDATPDGTSQRHVGGASSGVLPEVSTRVFAGGCIVSPPPQVPEVRVASEAVMSSLIATSLNRLGSALRAAGGSKTRTAIAQKNLDPLDEEEPRCVQLIRGRFKTDPFTIKKGAKGDQGIPCAVIRSSTGDLPGRVRTKLESKGVVLATGVELFVEAALRRSKDGSAWTLSPSLLYYGKTLDGRARRRERALALQVSFHPAGETADGGRAESGVVVFGDTEVGTTRCFDQIGGKKERELESAWFENPIPVGEPKKPLTVTAVLAETRHERPFLMFLADVFEGSKENLQAELETSLIASKQRAAELEEYKARQAALLDAQLRKSDAALEEIAYCALTDAMTSEEKAKRLAASTELYKAQIAANIAARVAGLPEPYPSPVVPSSGPRTGC